MKQRRRRREFTDAYKAEVVALRQKGLSGPGRGARRSGSDETQEVLLGRPPGGGLPAPAPPRTGWAVWRRLRIRSQSPATPRACYLEARNRRSATSAQMASTTPNGQAPDRKP